MIIVHDVFILDDYIRRMIKLRNVQMMMLNFSCTIKADVIVIINHKRRTNSPHDIIPCAGAIIRIQLPSYNVKRIKLIYII